MIMQTSLKTKPVVLTFSGHDPTGAAGVQADIESVNQQGCCCVSIVTVLTAQNTARFEDLIPQRSEEFMRQTELLLSETTIHACKIGLIGDARLAEVIAIKLTALESIPVVLDPILVAGVGVDVTDVELTTIMMDKLFTLATVLTPNVNEALSLTKTNDIEQAVEKLYRLGCEHILITGADEDTPTVNNIFFSQNKDPETYEWERLPGKYHGSGCTLSSSIAANLARGIEIKSAIEKAQDFTWNCLKSSFTLGSAQKHPNRFFYIR